MRPTAHLVLVCLAVMGISVPAQQAQSPRPNQDSQPPRTKQSHEQQVEGPFPREPKGETMCRSSSSTIRQAAGRLRGPTLNGLAMSRPGQQMDLLTAGRPLRARQASRPKGGRHEAGAHCVDRHWRHRVGRVRARSAGSAAPAGADTKRRSLCQQPAACSWEVSARGARRQGQPCDRGAASRRGQSGAVRSGDVEDTALHSIRRPARRSGTRSS